LVPAQARAYGSRRAFEGDAQSPRDRRALGGLFSRSRIALAVGVALDWLAFFLRRRSERWFATCDAEAYWWGWQISKTLGGLGRGYRDSRFGTRAVVGGMGVKPPAN
jgi:hypothetical protein